MCKNNLLRTENMKQYFKRKCLFPFISLVELLLICLILKILSYLLIPLAFGFILAAVRALFKEWSLLKWAKELEKESKELKRAEDLRHKVQPKLVRNMLWTYMVNYPALLVLIYIVLGYYLNYVDISRVVFSWAILFGFGFYIDDVFSRFIEIFRP